MDYINQRAFRIISIFLILDVVASTLGCSFFVPKMQTITIVASERDAAIFVNGNLEGMGTVQALLPRNRDVTILAKKEGYHTAEEIISSTTSTIGYLDIIGGFIMFIPYFGMFAPGFYKLETDNVTLLMQKEKDTIR
jgi:hypothetical protein